MQMPNGAPTAPGLHAATGRLGAPRHPPRCSYLYERVSKVKGVTVYGPSPAAAGRRGRASLAAFNVQGLHPTDVSTLLDASGVAVRSGHHCTQPVHRWAREGGGRGARGGGEVSVGEGHARRLLGACRARGRVWALTLGVRANARRHLGISSSARASAYIYNTPAEVDTFIAVLEDTIKFFQDA